SGAYVQNPEDVQQDANYVRRVTFNVGRVALVTATSLLLTQSLPGGVPAAGASVQQVIAFVDREGGSFLQQWSGLFVAEDESGGRVCFFLSDFESVHGEVGMGTGDSDRGSKADRRVGVAGVVCRAANSGHQRWSRGALLPQLFPAEYGSGLLV